jgi:hypothetical protein
MKLDVKGSTAIGDVTMQPALKGRYAPPPVHHDH